MKPIMLVVVAAKFLFLANRESSHSLDPPLLLAMNDEGRWMIRNNLTPAKTLPDFRNFIYPDSLQTINPGTVDIR